MSEEVTAILIAAAAYSVTNADGLMVMLAMMVGRCRPGRVVLGFLVASSVILLICYGVASFAALLPGVQWGWLGLIPICFGVVEIKRLVFPHWDEPPQRAGSGGDCARIMLLVLAGSGDNIAVFIPLFAESSHDAAMTMLLASFATGALWCAVVVALASNPRVARAGGRVAQWLLPVILIGVGMYILMDTTTDMR